MRCVTCSRDPSINSAAIASRVAGPLQTRLPADGNLPRASASPRRSRNSPERIQSRTRQRNRITATMAASRPSSSSQHPPSADPSQQLQEEASQQAEPASPPLPQRHTAVTPGPRASRLKELYAQSLKRTLGKAGWENFKGCYPTVAKNAEGVLKQVQGQMVEKLGEKCEVSLCHWAREREAGKGACIRTQ